jgi:branched-subunit amino acid ABC-type transport system permease component
VKAVGLSSTLQVVFSGLIDGCVYALIAVGMSLVYSITRVINLAQGGFVVLAALLAVALQNAGLHPLLALVVVVVVLAVCLAALDRVVLQPAARRATPDRLLLVTVGLLQAVGGAPSPTARRWWSRGCRSSVSSCGSSRRSWSR